METPTAFPNPASPYEIIGNFDPSGRFVLTCEHASAHIPPPLHADDADQTWLAQHWGWDIGIEDVTRVLLEETCSVGVFSRFSRLVCDPNRSPDEPSWIVTQIEGQPLSFNQSLDETERSRRLQAYHQPYHDAIDQVLHQRTALNRTFTLLAMHSFTPIYQGNVRTLEIGVLFDQSHADDAHQLASWIAEEGFQVELNQPYSGENGLIYSAWLHGNNHKIRYLELELRQDLIDTPTKARTIAARILPALQKL